MAGTTTWSYDWSEYNAILTLRLYGSAFVFHWLNESVPICWQNNTPICIKTKMFCYLNGNPLKWLPREKESRRIEHLIPYPDKCWTCLQYHFRSNFHCKFRFFVLIFWIKLMLGLNGQARLTKAELPLKTCILLLCIWQEKTYNLLEKEGKPLYELFVDLKAASVW